MSTDNMANVRDNLVKLRSQLQESVEFYNTMCSQLRGVESLSSSVSLDYYYVKNTNDEIFKRLTKWRALERKIFYTLEYHTKNRFQLSTFYEDIFLKSLLTAKSKSEPNDTNTPVDKQSRVLNNSTRPISNIDSLLGDTNTHLTEPDLAENEAIQQINDNNRSEIDDLDKFTDDFNAAIENIDEQLDNSDKSIENQNTPINDSTEPIDDSNTADNEAADKASDTEYERDDKLGINSDVKSNCGRAKQGLVAIKYASEARRRVLNISEFVSRVKTDIGGEGFNYWENMAILGGLCSWVREIIYDSSKASSLSSEEGQIDRSGQSVYANDLIKLVINLSKLKTRRRAEPADSVVARRILDMTLRSAQITIQSSLSNEDNKATIAADVQSKVTNSGVKGASIAGNSNSNVANNHHKDDHDTANNNKQVKNSIFEFQNSSSYVNSQGTYYLVNLLEDLRRGGLSFPGLEMVRVEAGDLALRSPLHAYDVHEYYSNLGESRAVLAGVHRVQQLFLRSGSLVHAQLISQRLVPLVGSDSFIGLLRNLTDSGESASPARALVQSVLSAFRASCFLHSSDSKYLLKVWSKSPYEG